MNEEQKGVDRLGTEYARASDDFKFTVLNGETHICSICHGTGAKLEIEGTIRDYASDKNPKHICKTLQKHSFSLWICPTCYETLKRARSMVDERDIKDPRPCLYCGGLAIRKQIYSCEVDFKNIYHEDGSLKWSYLECKGCGRKTSAYCYEYQSTEQWNQGKAFLEEGNK
jgi:hypothetical protein